ncbi:unnamed protein product [Caenorhabditis auriculariae]|uniref:LRRCT domain-containing protein n=1 Tax=Caenorhabditis auriculariae TaxID=2777116 RepID=A0A8S1HFL9_9PELO|nr:unnamed protein product [Caenorhabditis auriculariae]
MRLCLIFLLFFLICVVAFEPRKSADGRRPEKSDKAAAIKEKKAKKGETEVTTGEDENNEDYDYESKPEKVKKEKKNQKKKQKPTDEEEVFRDEDDGDDDDTTAYEACSGGRQELCHCDLNELNCGSIVMDIYTANFSSNSIVHLHEGLIVPAIEKSVSILDFSYNKIQFIDVQTFGKFKNLTKLNLSSNKISSLKPSHFANLGDTLHKLDLSNNAITKISDGLFDELKNLKKLILDGNKIIKWRKTMFRGLKNLKELSLDNCNIEELPADIFDELPALTEISLRNNPLTVLPTAVLNLELLEDLDISETKIAELHEYAFGEDLVKLEELYMQNMPDLYTVRSHAFCGLSSLKLLDISNSSELYEFDINAFGSLGADPGKKVTELKTLKLHNCNISTLNEELIDWEKLEIFTIGGNPIDCTCETAFLMDSPKFTFKNDASFPRCASPKELEGKNVATLKPYEACAAKKTEGKQKRMTTVFMMSMIMVFACVGAYFAYSTGRCSRIVTKLRVQVPQMSYSNLNNRQEDTLNLDNDFEPRPAEV